MKSNYKYNDVIYDTLELMLEKHQNITCIGHEPIIEKYIVAEDQGSYKITEVYKDVKDPVTEEITKVATEIKVWEPKLVDIEKERKIGNTFIYVDMKESHISDVRKLEINKQLNEINAWYIQRDYYQGKILRKEWEETDPRWTEYLEGCKVKQAERDVLLEELETL